jgi:eukaryotic-like serine/threonine-protein kinase
MEGAVLGSYRVLQKLGQGGMGAVYVGEHTLLGRKAAIKVLLPALSANQDIVQRFFNEARAATAINDAGIVQIFDFGYHTDGSAFIVMEYLEGEPLDGRLRRLGRLHANDAIRIVRQVATSLAAAHARGIIHRDLKPENIFLVKDAEVAGGERPKILDFGIAKLSGDAGSKVKTHTAAIMGTPWFMSPEQCRGAGQVDHRSDVYALGCVLFHLVTGTPPFDGEGTGDIIAAHLMTPPPAPSSRVPGVPPEVDQVVATCLAKSPDDRYPTMEVLASVLGQLSTHGTSPGASAIPAFTGTLPGASSTVQGVAAVPTTLSAVASQVGVAPSTRRRGLGVALAAIGVAAAAGVAVVIVTQGGAGGDTQPAADPSASEARVIPPDAPGATGPVEAELRLPGLDPSPGPDPVAEPQPPDPGPPDVQTDDPVTPDPDPEVATTAPVAKKKSTSKKKPRPRSRTGYDPDDPDGDGIPNDR